MKHKVTINPDKLANELANLHGLDRRMLVKKWQALYGTKPPPRMGKNFLMRGIAYQLQERTFDGLKLTAKRFLEKAAENNASGSTQKIAPVIAIKPGARLLREWHGITYEVIIMEDCVYCNGKRYHSLSDVARAITGTRWSGPRFFGLNKKESL